MKKNPFDRVKSSPTYAVAIGLYILTFVLGVVAFLAARRIVLSTHVRLFPGDVQAAQVGDGGLQLVNIITTMVLVVRLIAVLIGGFEYHFRRVGQESSWRLFARTLAGELAILLLALFM